MSTHVVLPRCLGRASLRKQGDHSVPRRVQRATSSHPTTLTPRCPLRLSTKRRADKLTAAFKTYSSSRLNGRCAGEVYASASGNGAVSVDVLPPKKKIACFVSGGGSNMKKIYEAIQDGRINGEITVVVSDKSGCGGWTYAVEKRMTTVLFPPKKGEEGNSAADVVKILKAEQIDYVLLAGYLKLVPLEIVQAFPQAILNIHPALLPAFGGKGYHGMNVHRAVVASGARWTGPTVHFIDEEYDRGSIIAQTPVPVYPTDTPEEVAARVLAQEWVLYSVVVSALCSGSYQWREDGVIMLKTQDPEHAFA